MVKFFSFPYLLVVALLNSYQCSIHVHALTEKKTDDEIRIVREIFYSSRPDMDKATNLYKKIISEGKGRSRVDAMFELANLNTLPPAESYSLLSRASEEGHAMAQHHLSAALFTGVGFGGLVPRDSGRALLLEQFSALSGTPEAHLGLGYRYLLGEGVPQSCENALPHLEYAANEAAFQYQERGGYNMFAEDSYLAKEVEAAVRSDGPDRGERVTADMVGYYEHLAIELDSHAILSLIRIFSHGSREIPVNMHKVMHYLHVAATGLNSSTAAGHLGYLLATGMTNANISSGEVEVIDRSKAPEFLQRSYADNDSWGILGMGYCFYSGNCGGGINRNITRALECFQRAQSKHPDAAFYIGEILMGMGGKYEVSELSAEGFAVDEQEEDGDEGEAKGNPALAEVQVDVAKAFQFYSAASARGHLLASHRMGQIQMRGGGEIEERADRVGDEADRARGAVSGSFAQRQVNRRGRGGAAVRRSCERAAAAFRSVAQHGDWSQQLTVAHSMYSAGDRCGALRVFAQLASMGYETAQANAAFLLSQVPPVCSSSVSSEAIASLELQATEAESSSVSIISVQQWESLMNISEVSGADGSVSTDEVSQASTTDLFESRALSLYRQSALLGNAGSYRKMGDMYYYGSGGLPRNKHEASLLYQLAADFGQSHAMFNLGVMHQIGDGIEQDFHLAKRYYDQTAEYDPSARVPSKIAVYILRAHKEFQARMGKQITDDAIAVIASTLNPFLQVGEWYDATLRPLFQTEEQWNAYDVNSGPSGTGEMTSWSIFGWRCWDKARQFWNALLSSFSQVSSYMSRFSTRFSKSPQQAVYSLLSKIGSIMKSKEVEGKDSNDSDLLLPKDDPAIDNEAKSDYELILLLTLWIIILILVDSLRQRFRATRQQERERRRNEWNNNTVLELREEIRAAVNRANTGSGDE